MESTERQPRVRAYGQACAQCRMKKRRCRPTGIERCEFCDEDGERCIFVPRRKRARKSLQSTSNLDGVRAESNGASHTAKRVRQDTSAFDGFGDVSFSSEQHHHLPGNLLQTLEQTSSNDDSMSATLLALANERLGASSSPSAALQRSSALAHPVSASTLIGTSGSPAASADRDLYAEVGATQADVGVGSGESAVYATAMSTFVNTVCGDVWHFEVNEELLSLYFTWQANQHNAVIERLFRRDMARSPPGPYFSPALLYAIYAQASRITQPPDRGRSYTLIPSMQEKAQALCIASISETPTIPIIQTLLELAGKELATGQGSKGWLFGGMALRMVTDMGLHTCLKQQMEDRHTTEEKEDLEVRTRLFWSAYCWDKFYALTMGRQPMLTFPYGDVEGLVPPLTLTQQSQPVTTPLESNGRGQSSASKASTAAALWAPLYLPTQRAFPYDPQPFFATETLHASCLLYREIEEIIRWLYQSTSVDTKSVEHQAWMDRMTARLIKWRSQVAPGVLLDTSYLPSSSPPPHVLSVNILYRTAWILLKRPRGEPGRSQVKIDEAQSLCASRSAEIHALFKLHERTFGLQNLTYLMAYMAYVSATVDINEALDSDEHRARAGKTRLTFTLQILTQAAIHTPGIRRSISHLRRRIAGQTGAQSNGRRLESRTTAHPSFQGGTMETRAPSPTRDLDGGGEQSVFASEGLQNGQTSGPALDLEELFATLLPDQGASASWLGDLGGATQGQDGHDVWDWFDTTWA